LAKISLKWAVWNISLRNRPSAGLDGCPLSERIEGIEKGVEDQRKNLESLRAVVEGKGIIGC
jgi:hypothetical protein